MHGHVGESMEDRYFFTKKGAKYISGNNKYRTANNGCWEVSGSEEHISPPPNQNLDMMMGIKKTLVFKIRKFPNNCRRTDWLMHEYSLALINNNVKVNFHSLRVFSLFVIFLIIYFVIGRLIIIAKYNFVTELQRYFGLGYLPCI